MKTAFSIVGAFCIAFVMAALVDGASRANPQLATGFWGVYGAVIGVAVAHWRKLIP